MIPERVYVGQAEEMGGCTVVYYDGNGECCPLPPRYDLRNHSPDGFQWGYGGSGPSQLALAMCAHALASLGYENSDEIALRIYQTFKRSLIEGLPQGEDFVLRRMVAIVHIESAMQEVNV